MAGEKILVVDDEPHLRKLLHRYLSHAGYTIGLAGDGLEALELVRQQIPDLVITDVNMPNMNGLELTLTGGSVRRPSTWPRSWPGWSRASDRWRRPSTRRCVSTSRRAQSPTRTASA